MKKRYSGLLLAACLLLGCACPVHAVEQQGKDGWKAEFTGKAIESNFSSQSLADEIFGLQPGDSVEIRVAVVNASGRSTDWYMSNEVLQSLEDSSPANGGAYQYVLTYHGSGDPAVLYSSEQVGGETVSSAGQGLHEATDNLEQFFYLDRLAKGEQGQITLRVSLNEETQGNSYQNTLARLQLNFAVEGTGGGGGRDKTVLTPGTASVIYSPGAVQTGDPGGMVFWSAAALLAGLALVIIGVVSQKKSRGGQEL